MLVSIVAACGSDSDPKPKSTSKLVGKWNVVSSQTLLSVNGKTYKQYLVDNLGLSEEEADIYTGIVEQLLSLSGFYAEVEFRNDFTWTGNSEFVSTPATGGWELTSDEKTLTLTNDAEAGVTQTAKITKLTDTELWFETEPQDLEAANSPPGAQYTGVIKCTRK